VSKFWQDFFSPLNAPITSTIIIVLVLSLVFILISKKIEKLNPQDKTPLWMVPFVWIVDLINGFVKANIGKRWKSYAPWFVSLTILLFFSNISSVFCLNNPTGYLVITLTLGFLSSIVIQITGIVSQGLKSYLKGFLDPFFVMLPMNIISELALPLSLGVRLFCNITSGSAISTLIKNVLGWGSIAVMPVINAIFDIAFGVIQVTVFVILSIIFTSMKINDEEKIY
jgi:F-type H+-transporting ATPase subunit a